MTRVLLLCEYPTLNGGERSLLAVIDRLRGSQPPTAEPAPDAFQFFAIAPETGRLSAALQERGIALRPLHLHDTAGKRLSREEAVAQLHQTLQTVRPDVIHANSLAMGRLTGALGDVFPAPRTAHLRDIMKLSAAAIADLNRNDRLVAVSDATRSFHVAQGLDPARVTTIHNGVDCDAFRPRAIPDTGEPEWSLWCELGLPKSAFLVLSVGQIGLRKGQDLLAEVVIELHSRYQESREIHCVIVGERNSSKRESIEFERKLVRRFADAGLSDRLHRLGYRNDVARLMNEADLLVHAAHQEPFGRVLLEAGASGLPVIATNVGGTPEIFEDGVSARLVPPGDARRLADAMDELIGDAELRSRFSAAARERIVSCFPIERAAEQLAALWRLL